MFQNCGRIVGQKGICEVEFGLRRWCASGVLLGKGCGVMRVEGKGLNAIWRSAFVARDLNTTEVDLSLELSRFMIPPSAYQSSLWMEKPIREFNPMNPWIDANIEIPIIEESKQHPIETMYQYFSMECLICGALFLFVVQLLSCS